MPETTEKANPPQTSSLLDHILLASAGWTTEEIIRAHLMMWGLAQEPPLFTMKSISARLEVSASELSDLFGPKPRRSYHKLRKAIEEATS